MWRGANITNRILSSAQHIHIYNSNILRSCVLLHNSAFSLCPEESEEYALSRSLESTRPITDLMKKPPHRYKEDIHQDKSRRRNYNLNSTYAKVDILGYVGEHEMAAEILNRHRLMGHPVDIKFYNKLLQVLVSAEFFDDLMATLFQMECDDIECDNQTFAVCLEAYGKMNDSEDEILEVLEKMETRNIDLITDILDRVILREEQVASIRKALLKVGKGYLMDDVRSRTLRELRDCDQRVVQQIENELKGSVLVEPVRTKPLQTEPLTKREINIEKNLLKQEQYYDHIMKPWKKAFRAKLHVYYDANKDVKMKKANLHECLTLARSIPPDELCEIVFDHIIPLLAAEPRGVSIVAVSKTIGRLMYKRFCMKFLEKNGMDRKVANIASDYLADKREKCPREKWHEISKEYGISWEQDIHPSSWTTTVKLLTASIPIQILKETGKVDTREMPFNDKNGGVLNILNHGYNNNNNKDQKSASIKRTGVLRLHSLVCKLHKNHQERGLKHPVETDLVPMVIPPQPWSSVDRGGYLLTQSKLLRSNEFYEGGTASVGLRDKAETDYKDDDDDDAVDVVDEDDDVDNDIDNDIDDANDDDEDDDDDDDDDADHANAGFDNMNTIYDSMNILGNCAWRVNTDLLDIMIEVMKNGGDVKLDIIGSIAMAEAEQELKRAANKVREHPELGRQPIGLAKKEYKELYSLHMTSVIKLSLANHFRDMVIYNPHNLDFRGRAYPLAPHCCHIGGDVQRSMLEFAKGKKLGPNGLNWLKIHLVNVHGQLKKASLQERIAFADLHMQDIMDSADDPLAGQGWWKHGDDPWQTLIACKEITKAVRSGNPEDFVSHLPVQMDGSCNGLQHYAALGRDVHGAFQVNLIPSERPQDVYAEVASLVEDRRQKDEEGGKAIAGIVKDSVTRKVVKQTVMTTVYGVTRYGARQQVLRQVEDLDRVPPEHQWQAAGYISSLVFDSLEQMLPSAKMIQNWLTDCADRISKAGKVVEWRTPLGLLVKQDYYTETGKKERKTVVETPFYGVSISHVDGILKPDTRKQKGGFAPNYVHSLDATHMMYTAVGCGQRGLVFASVHDSFWTHPCDVDVLNKVCREKFIELHKQPLLENLKKGFDRDYGGLSLPKNVLEGGELYIDELPQRGELDIDLVLQSVYFFS